uniref:Methyltransferase domain-containing protein n=2 Tax=Lutzomyia longipalpis TaxID=7200 RepID=A0A1B0C8U1_LUTLO
MCSVVGVQEKLREIVGFLEQHQGIIDCHMVDFLWAKHWDNLIPDALREELEVNAKVIKENIHEILSGSSKCDYKHLREFLSDARKHSLEEFSECKTLEDLLQDKETPSLRVVDFMTPKKQHEVKLASSLISWLCRDSKASVVIDAGDGKGYLSSCLAFEHNLHVIGLEANAAYQESAQKRVSKLKKKWKKTEDGGNYKSLAVRVTPNLRIGTICKEAFPEIEQPDCCLSGLHTCGDLAVSCLEIFTQDPSVRYLCNIGCCYNLLTRFPVSTFLSSDVSFILSSKAKMLAFIDAGDGKGYLSSCLAFEHNLHVIGLEANAAYQESAQKRVFKLKKKWKKTEDGGNYKSLAVRVTPNLRIGTICKDVFPEIEQPDCCLSGLHTCGDLAVSCLEIFTQDPSVRYLCNIGCCYNLLTRFPVSTFLSSDVSFILSPKAKMLACQSLNKRCSRAVGGSLRMSKHLCLESINLVTVATKSPAISPSLSRSTSNSRNISSTQAHCSFG